MPNFDSWDWTLIGVAGFVAVTGLVRLMRSHRNKVLGEFRANMAMELNSKPKPAEKK